MKKRTKNEFITWVNHQIDYTIKDEINKRKYIMFYESDYKQQNKLKRLFGSEKVSFNVSNNNTFYINL